MIKIIINVVFILCISIYTNASDFEDVKNTSKSSSFEKKQIIISWDLLEKKEYKEVLEKVHIFYGKNSNYDYMWGTILGAIYFEEEKYDEALEVISKFRDKLEVAYAENDLEKTDEIIEFTYHRMVLISAESKYNLNLIEAALSDFILYSREIKDPDVYDRIATCYYILDDMKKALEFLKMAYKAHEDHESKLLSAYNIGAISAKLNDIKSTIKWLEIPLNENKRYWLDKINSDEDFKKILSDIEFIEFLKRYQ